MENLEINVPIFRAKKIDSDEYVEGFYEGWQNKHFIVVSPKEYFKIEPTTLAIHFPDMLDSQGNKIFASLSKDGKGGDICRMVSEMENYVAEFTSEGLKFYEYLDNGKFINSSYFKIFSIRECKVIGIQQ